MEDKDVIRGSFFPKPFGWFVVGILVAFMISDYSQGKWMLGTVELLLSGILAVAYYNDKDV